MPTMSEDAAITSPTTITHTEQHSGHASPTSQSTQSRPSSSRAIAQAPFSTAPVSRRPSLATASLSPTEYANPSPVGGGPTSASYVVPPRPKPGRKPATDEPASKRKAQNRESQRAFRARKAAKLSEMQAQVESEQQRHRRELDDRRAEIDAQEVEMRQMQAALAARAEAENRLAQERDYWKEQVSALRQELELVNRRLSERNASHSSFFPTEMQPTRQDSPTRNSITTYTPLPGTPQSYSPPKLDIGCGNCKANGECACLNEMTKLPTEGPFMSTISLNASVPLRGPPSPMKDVQSTHPSPTNTSPSYADREIDFTVQFARRGLPENRSSINFLTGPNEEQKCGFCTDESNCLCKDQSLSAPNDDLPQSNESNVLSSDCAKTGPGSCEQCRVNPQQRAWCQRVAQLRSSATSDYFTASSRNSSISSTLDSLEPRSSNASMSDLAKYSIGCSDAYNLLEGRVPMNDQTMSNLRTVPPSTQVEPPRKYSALELDTAGVIATLQNSMTPLTPRKSDGLNADLVKIAQEQQRKSDSPGSISQRGSPALPISGLVNE